MKSSLTNKRKIFNDPVYGFITIPGDLAFDIIEHPCFQRLRRIKQLGLTHLVYPGALHTRFHHAIGAMHLMMQAINTLKSKGHNILPEEEEAVLIAILLHDIGHGPFSHALENSIVKGTSHEFLSALLMNKLNLEFNNKLDLAIQIFNNKYQKEFLHQLVSSQLDVDRLDFLKRDSYYTGVSEGVIGTERIIKMFNIRDNQLIAEEKGIYSIEKFIIARRIMYWQVYFHKTVVSAEHLLITILNRAMELAGEGQELFGSPDFLYFLKAKLNKDEFRKNPVNLERFAALDDLDIFSAIKVWTKHPDNILSLLSKKLVNRQLNRLIIQDKPFEEKLIESIRKKCTQCFSIDREDAKYLVHTGNIINHAYNPKQDKIYILSKNGSISDISKKADQLNIRILSKSTTKHFLYFPKEINLD